MQRREMIRLTDGKFMTTIFHDRYLVSMVKVMTTIFNDRYLVYMLMGMIVCGIAIVILLVTIGALYV